MAVRNDALGARTVRKVTLRIIPFVFVLYIVNYIDRANIGYASLGMNEELGLTSQAFGLAAGLFFIGYFLFEVPSNIALAKFGARKWIARILLTWGAIGTLMAFVDSEWQLYTLRFLLGVAEAGFFPGVIVYLSFWFRGKELATATALFTAAIPVSYIIAAPMSTLILDHVHWLGLSSWRWVFILECLPAIALGIACYYFLTERPKDAKWLTTEERNWLEGELAEDNAASADRKHLGTWQAISNPKVLYLAVIYFVYQAGSLGVGYWMPQIIKGFSATLSNVQIGLIGMVPYIAATVVMIWWSRRSDRTGERKIHTYVPLGFAAVGLFLSGLVIGTPVLAVLFISISLAGLYAFKSPFWTLPRLFLDRGTAVVAIAAINSIGNLGGFAGPYALGFAKDSTGSSTAGLIFLSALLVIAFAMAMAIRLKSTRTATDPGHDADPSEATVAEPAK
ncbi:MFS transporter [Rhodococcus opacus]|uniref:MFS transporter n=1 Tax=Rhodococcus opacus TaxID=37919 RepID=UPI001C4829AD|nr:MFS transporter [Rhodococcus opacus]MBV6759168.1 MFS transporter [Rhodococcus opacus]